MRFLHTADWHIGKQLRGRRRLDEQEAVLNEILGIARREEVDCLLVCGDLFDSQAPPPDAERLVYDFLAEAAGLRIAIVAIAGNHDHPRRLEAIRRLSERMGIHVRPVPVPADQGGIVEIRKDDEAARVAVLPFISEGRILDACRLMAPQSEWAQEYRGKVAAILEKLSSGFSRDTINILCAHLMVSGAFASGSERAIHIAHPYDIDPETLPASAHYIALGHLHRPQEVQAKAPSLYCGSPLQLDFGEQGQEKRVLVIDASKTGEVDVRPVPITSGRHLRDVEGTLDELRLQASRFGDDFLRVTVRTEGPVPGIADQVREILPAAVDIRLSYPRSGQAQEGGPSRDFVTPRLLFEDFYARQHGVTPSDPLSALFDRLYEEVIDASD